MMMEEKLKGAILAQDVKAVKRILAEDPPCIEGKDGDGVPYSFLAARTGNLALVRFIVEYSRASLNETDEAGRNILHYGAESGKCDLIEYLTERCGMSPAEGDRQLVTPFDLAVRLGHMEARSYFERICGSAYENMYRNPVRTGMFPDPSVVRVGGDYYMVNSTFVYFPCIPVSHSTDLIHWNIIGYAITEPQWAMLDELEGGRGYWAPDISFHKGRFYITATYRMNDGKGVCRRQMVTWSDAPEGPYGKPVLIDEDGIDPSIFWEEDGRCFMLLNRGARIFELDPDTMEKCSDAVLLYYGAQKRAPEGPHLLKKDGYYYLFLAEGGTGMGHRITVSRSTILMGVYEPCPYNPVMRQSDESAGIQRCGHGKPVMTQNGQWYMVYLCGRLLEGSYTMLGRETALDLITWTADGWPLVNGLKGPSVLAVKPDLPAGEGLKNSRDEFGGQSLSFDWMTSRAPETGGVSVEGDCLRIRGSKAPLDSVKARNMVLRRQTSFSFEAETALIFDGNGDLPLPGQDMGMLFYYDEHTWMKFGLFGTEQGIMLQAVEHILDEDRITAAKQPVLPEGSFCFHIKTVTRGLTRTCSWRLQETESWKQAAVLEHVDYLCDEAVKVGKRFTGAMAGMYACGGERPFAAKFKYFEYQDS